jgi:glutaredoxin 3
MKNIIIYSTPFCDYCLRAKRLFSKLNIPFTDVDVSIDKTLRDKLIKKYNWQTVPLIIIDDTCIGGYDDLVKLHSTDKLFSMLKG